MTDQERPDIMVHATNENSNDQQPTASSDDLLSAQRGTSRKREREPSIEPQTPKSEAGELAATDPNERKPHVAKRNRLEPLDEVESPPRSPPLDNSKAAASAAGAATPPNTTPPLPNADQTPSQETVEPPKLQNIRKRVKDLNWKENGSPVRGGSAAPRPKSIYDTTMEDAEQWAADEEEMEAQEAHGPNEDTVIPDARPATPPSQPQEDVDIGSPQHAATVESVQKPRAEDDSTGKGTQEPPTQANGPPEPSSVLAPAVDLTETAPEDRPSRQHTRRSSDSDPPSDPERTKSPSRKRKLVNRESSFANDSHTKHEQHAKRPREKQDDDVSIKTIKEVKEDESPAIPDVPGQTPVLPASPPKATGFAAFSGASPFAKVTGNAFGATSSSPDLASKPSDQAATSSSSKAAAPQPSRSFTSGFGAFMSASTPFASIASAVPSIFGNQSSAPPKRSASPDTSSQNAGLTNRSRSPSVGSLNRRKSPPPSGPTKPKPGAGFGSYNNANFGFGSAAAKTRHSPSPSLDATSKKETRDEEGSEKKKQRTEESTQTEGEDEGDGEKRTASWNELLAAKEAGAKEEESAEQQNKKLKVEEIEVHTGEEDEETRHQARGRLFHLSDEGAWRERGTGTLKINVKRQTGRRARLVMRADAVHRVILNAPLFHGMSVTLAPDPKFVKIASLENGKVAQYLFKCLGAAAAVTGQDLHDQILSYIPPIDQDDEQDGKSADA